MGNNKRNNVLGYKLLRTTTDKLFIAHNYEEEYNYIPSIVELREQAFPHRKIFLTHNIDSDNSNNTIKSQVIDIRKAYDSLPILNT